MLTLLQSPAFSSPSRLLPSQSRKLSRPSAPCPSFSLSVHFRPCSPTTANASNTQIRKAECKSSNIFYGDDEEDGFGGRKGDGEDYDKNPEFAEILGSLILDPEKAKSKIDERFRKKRNSVLQAKTGSPIPMEVKFNQFDFTNSYIWFEFYNSPLEKDVSLICNTIRSWHIIGRLGACNSMNMQLSQAHMEKSPSYDAIQGANVTPTTFYNIGDLEIQENYARIWVDIGTSEPLLLDVLINALTQISSDCIGIKQVVFGGSEFEDWKDILKEDVGYYNVHRI